MSVKDVILKRRKELGLSQTDLAKRAGLQPPAISQYESGVRNPSYEALIKLSNALETSVDFLISGTSTNNSGLQFDKKSELIIKMISSQSQEIKDKILEYIIFLCTGHKTQNWDDIFTDPSDYAEHIRKKHTNLDFPLDLYELANKLEVKVYHDDMSNNAEGILFNGEEKTILLDKTRHPSRIRFTFATLLGHSIIPWHSKSSYVARKKGDSTLLTEDLSEMEAHKFALSLLMPPDQLEKDFLTTNISIIDLKVLSDQKYNVSLFTLLNRLVEFSKDKYSIVQSEANKIIKTFPGSRPLKETGEIVDLRSKAASFFVNPSQEEEIRQGQVPAECWLHDATAEESIYEESIYNPKFGTVLTLLKLKKGI